jgi:excisionase family DNA binding protein
MTEIHLLNVSQAAERLGLKVGYVYKIIHAGDLPVVNVGNGRKMWKIRSDHLDQFIESRTSSACSD